MPPRQAGARGVLDSSVETLGGWRLLRGCTLPGPLPCALAVVALHPRHGIALVDPLPQLTPDAEQRLYQRLHQARFSAVYGEAWPPARHLALHAEELTRLPDVLADAFRDQAPPEMPGGDAWMDTVTRALHPGLPLASAPSPSAGRMRQKPVKPARPWRRVVALAAGLALVLGLGFGWAFWPRPQLAVLAPASQAAAGTGRLAPEAPPALAPPPPAEPAPEADLAAPPAAVPSPPAEDVAALAPTAEPVPNPAFGEALTPPAHARPAALPVANLPAATMPMVARNARRCQALVQRIQTGEEASEDELIRLHACRSGG